MKNKDFCFVIVPKQEFEDKLSVNIINRNFNYLLSDLTEYEFPLNKETTKERFYDDLIFVIKYHDDENDNFLYKKPDEEIDGILKANHVNPDMVIEFIQNNMNKFPEKTRLAFIEKPTTVIPENTDNKKPKNKRTHVWNSRVADKCRLTIEHYILKGVRATKITENIAYSELANNNRHIWAIRSADGTFPCLFYTDNYDQPKRSDIVNLMKNVYALETCCHYLDVRPILFEHWVKLDDNKKYSLNDSDYEYE